MADSEEDWQNLSDAATRRRIQNRIAQRNYRRNIRKRLIELEEQVRSASAAVVQPAASLLTGWPRRQDSLGNDIDDAWSAPSHDKSTRKRKTSRKSLYLGALANQPEAPLGSDSRLIQLLPNSIDPLEILNSPSEVVSPSETTTLLDPSTLWNPPTPNEEVAYPLLGTEWPNMQSIPESTTQKYKALKLSNTDKDLYNHLQEDMIDMTTNLSGGQTTLHLGAKKGHQKIVTMLLERGGNVDDTDMLGQSALHMAAAGGHQAVVQLLIDRGAGVNLKDALGRTSLHLAAENGNAQTVQSLLQQTAGKETKDTMGRTPLHIAIECGHENVVRILLDNGADPRARVSL